MYATITNSIFNENLRWIENTYAIEASNWTKKKIYFALIILICVRPWPKRPLSDAKLNKCTTNHLEFRPSALFNYRTFQLLLLFKNVFISLLQLIISHLLTIATECTKAIYIFFSLELPQTMKKMPFQWWMKKKHTQN